MYSGNYGIDNYAKPTNTVQYADSLTGNGYARPSENVGTVSVAHNPSMEQLIAKQKKGYPLTPHERELYDKYLQMPQYAHVRNAAYGNASLMQ